jgi:hypothetical protein
MSTYRPDDAVPDWFDDIHADDPRNPENHPDDEPPPQDPPQDEVPPGGDEDPYAGHENENPFFEPVDILGIADMAGHPELTPECAPSLLYNYATSEGERVLADPVGIVAHCIGAASAVASDAWRIKPKLHDHWTQQPRVWTCVIKPPGARGTDMLRAAYKPVEQIANELRAEYEREMGAFQASLEGLNGKELEQAKKNEPRQTRLITNDATVEPLSELLRYKGKHGKVGYYDDELTTFIDFGRYKSGKGGGGARAAMLQAYDGGPQQIDRVMRGNVYVANWSVTASGNIQPRKLLEMGIELASDGLFQRFMVVHAKPTPLYEDDDKPLSSQPYAVYRNALRALYKMRPPKDADGKPIKCFLDEGGRKVRLRLMRLVQRLNHDRTLPELISEAASKWSGLFARLALIFHLLELAEQQVNGEELAEAQIAGVTTATAEKAAAFIRRILLPNLFRLGFVSSDTRNGAPGDAKN